MNTTEAPLFTPLLMQDAPLASRTLLEQAHRYFGFVPQPAGNASSFAFSIKGISHC